jgi:hypothetical protein
MSDSTQPEIIAFAIGKPLTSRDEESRDDMYRR